MILTVVIGIICSGKGGFELDDIARRITDVEVGVRRFDGCHLWGDALSVERHASHVGRALHIIPELTLPASGMYSYRRVLDRVHRRAWGC